ncbi:MAG: hypothetical protein WBS54_07065 [Acidobacteriota bacterium]
MTSYRHAPGKGLCLPESGAAEWTGALRAPAGIELASLGSAAWAERVARRAERAIPAYGRFLSPGGPYRRLSDRPLMDKGTYIHRFPWPELVGQNERRLFAVYGSGGSSGRIFYWPLLRSQHRYSAWGMRKFLERWLDIRRRRTLAVNALYLGSWWSGTYLVWLLDTIALDARYPFTAFTPGDRHEEIVELIAGVEKGYDQILLCIYPSAISHLTAVAERMGKPLPLPKLRYLTLGEPFPERLRMALGRKAGHPPGHTFFCSSYGSTDTGLLGTESQATIALRQLLTSNTDLAEELGIPQPVPLLFHGVSLGSHIENVGGELCVTRWQGIPLVRYNLHDSVRLYHWRRLRAAALGSRLWRPEDEPLRAILRKSSRLLPNLIAVSGRSDRCLLLGGIKLTEAMLDAAVHSTGLEGLLTGVYFAEIRFDEEWQHLHLDLELRGEAAPAEGLEERIRQSILEALFLLKPVLKEQWEQAYRSEDHDPRRRALRVRICPWPALSRHLGDSVKHLPIVLSGDQLGGPDSRASGSSREPERRA